MKDEKIRKQAKNYSKRTNKDVLGCRAKRIRTYDSPHITAYNAHK